MHPHASQLLRIRTTVELSDSIRAKLLDLAARRGERGFSAVVEEAVARYIEEEERGVKKAVRARAAVGAMDEEDAPSRDGVR